MAMHFAGDYFHYDNKFWRTFKTLFSKPGLATLEYINGKRAKYLNPIQLYIFVTTVFFLFILPEDNHSQKKSEVKVTQDSLPTLVKDSLKAEPVQSQQAGDDSSEPTDISITIGDNLSFMNLEQNSFKAYDSAQQTLPKASRDGWFERYMIKKKFAHEKKYPDNLMNDLFKQKFIHNFPKVFFLLLPFFALLLHIVFRRKTMFYVDHLIFSIHFHSFVFICYGIIALLTLVPNSILVNSIAFCMFLGLGFYFLFSLRRVYPSAWWKLILKQLFVSFTYLVGFIVTAILLLLFTFIIM